METKSFDVIVVGSGAAGLCCAENLIQLGLKVLILEASHRPGGRIFTHHEPGFESPIELGAEFVHGVSDPVFDRLAISGQSFFDVQDSHLYFDGKELNQKNEFWEQIQSIVKKAKRLKGKDKSIRDFVEA